MMTYNNDNNIATLSSGATDTTAINPINTPLASAEALDSWNQAISDANFDNDLAMVNEFAANNAVDISTAKTADTAATVFTDPNANHYVFNGDIAGNVIFNINTPNNTNSQDNTVNTNSGIATETAASSPVADVPYSVEFNDGQNAHIVLGETGSAHMLIAKDEATASIAAKNADNTYTLYTGYGDPHMHTATLSEQQFNELVAGKDYSFSAIQGLTGTEHLFDYQGEISLVVDDNIKVNFETVADPNSDDASVTYTSRLNIAIEGEEYGSDGVYDLQIDNIFTTGELAIRAESGSYAAAGIDGLDSSDADGSVVMSVAADGSIYAMDANGVMGLTDYINANGFKLATNLEAQQLEISATEASLIGAYAVNAANVGTVAANGGVGFTGLWADISGVNPFFVETLKSAEDDSSEKEQPEA